MTRYATFLSAGLTAFVALFLYGCQFGKADPQLLLPPDHVLLQANQSVQTADGLTVRGDTVSVSICPPNADCFAPNSARAILTLSKNTQSSRVRLFTFIPNYVRPVYLRQPPDWLIDSTSITFGGKPYKVILRDGHYAAGSENRLIQQVVVEVAPL